MRLYGIALVLTCLLLAACTQVQEPQQTVQEQQDTEDPHMCNDGEKEVNGACELAEENNVDIYGQLGAVPTISEDTEFGYFVRPEAEGSYPAVVLIHEWWGLNQNIKDLATLLAQEGYVVMAMDLYGEVAQNSSEAARLMNSINQDTSNAKMRGAVSYLRDLPYVNGNIGSMGWCFGGGQSLQLALSGEQMDATVIYYGRLTNDTKQLSAIHWPVLGVFGALDTGIPVSSVEAFQGALNELGVENDIHIYPDVGHAFANPSGARYGAAETKDAWEKTLAFFEKNLK